MKLSVLCLFSIFCCACAAQQPSTPPASITVEKIATASDGCQIKVSVFNATHIAWHVVHFAIAFRNQSLAAVGQYRNSSNIYTEPGRGILFDGMVRGISCEEIAAASLFEFSYLTEYEHVAVEASSIPITVE